MWQAFEGKRDSGQEGNVRGGAVGVRREGGKGLRGGHYFRVLNISGFFS